MELDYEKSETAPMDKMKSWWTESWEKLAAFCRKIILDNYAVIILVLAIAIVFSS